MLRQTDATSLLSPLHLRRCSESQLQQAAATVRVQRAFSAPLVCCASVSACARWCLSVCEAALLSSRLLDDQEPAAWSRRLAQRRQARTLCMLAAAAPSGHRPGTPISGSGSTTQVSDVCSRNTAPPRLSCCSSAAPRMAPADTVICCAACVCSRRHRSRHLLQQQQLADLPARLACLLWLPARLGLHHASLRVSFSSAALPDRSRCASASAPSFFCSVHTEHLLPSSSPCESRARATWPANS